MKTITRFYLKERDCSIQEVVYHILPELKLRRVFQAVQFVNSNLPRERVKVLLLEKGPKKLPNDRGNIFKKSKLIDTKIDQINCFLVESIVLQIIFVMLNFWHIMQVILTNQEIQVLKNINQMNLKII